MKRLTSKQRRATALMAILVVVSLLSAIVGALVARSSLDSYIATLETAVESSDVLTPRKLPSVPGTFTEAIESVKERAQVSILPVVDRPDAQGEVGESVGTAVVVTTDGWVIVHKDVYLNYGSRARVVHDSTLYEVETWVPIPQSDYYFAETEMSHGNVATFGDSEVVATGQMVFVLTGDGEVRPRAVASALYGGSVSKRQNADVRWRRILLDHEVDDMGGSVVTDAAGSVIGFMDDKDSVQPLHHLTPYLNTALTENEAADLKIGLRFRDLSRVFENGVSSTGLRVTSVVRGSVAERSGIEVGDIVLRVDGHEVSSVVLSERVLMSGLGGEMVLQIERDGTIEEIVVILE